ncbi:MAG TPA: heme o synthase [Thermoanaerobaculia bacterium]|nr:heme o synthase [Thermoanaerobaculia bacterium]
MMQRSPIAPPRLETLVERPAPAAFRLADWTEMTKPGITLMVVLTAGLGFLLAEALRPGFRFLLLLHTLIGTGLISAGGSVLNHVLERETDSLMRRTATRPLPSGRVDPDFALLYGVVLGVAGLVWLAVGTNLLTALLGAVALAGYVFVYTPLKRVTSLATVIGAIPGALPPVMGWSAVTGEVGLAAWVLFGILFFWQMPHFLAIAWLCREDYASAGFPMLTVLDREGAQTARQMILYGAALVPISLMPSVLGLMGTVYFVGTLALGLAYLGASFAFARTRSTSGARWLMLCSLLYLPGILLAMLIDRITS